MHSTAANNTAATCFDGVGNIFKDCIDPTWQRAFTAQKDTQWQIIHVGRHHNRVLDIQFNGSKNQRFGITAGPHSNPNTPHSWLDLTAFKSGQLHFDIRIIDFAHNINGLEISLDCGRNCTSEPLDINPAQQGQWQSVSIDIQRLITRGLEITQVHTGFAIQPVAGEQQGVHIQLDNIRLEANIPAPMDLVVL
ncbi:putative glycoside hydrolase [Marinagarivorans algicola]|nr:putative glycoside hydrolase [Marinagarivorans algicola]